MSVIRQNFQWSNYLHHTTYSSWSGCLRQRRGWSPWQPDHPEQKPDEVHTRLVNKCTISSPLLSWFFCSFSSWYLIVIAIDRNHQGGTVNFAQSWIKLGGGRRRRRGRRRSSRWTTWSSLTSLTSTSMSSCNISYRSISLMTARSKSEDIHIFHGEQYIVHFIIFLWEK